MKIIILLVGFLLFLYSENSIKRNYTFIDDGVYMNDIFPNQERIKLFNIKSNMSIFNIKAFSLMKKLREYNISSNNVNKIASIRFNRKSNFDDTIIRDFLREKFLERYEDIEIKEITIKSLRNINMANMFVKKIIVAPYALSRNTGSFKAIFDFEGKQKTIFYNFKIIATLPGIKLTKNVVREEILTSFNTKGTRIELSTINKPLYPLPPYSVSSKNLKKNHILTVFDTKKEYLVKKNEQIEVILNLDGIEIISHFKILENGYMNSKIKIKNIGSGKIRVAKVVGKSKVSLK